MRSDGRQQGELRSFAIALNPNKYAEGSVLIEVGNTKVLCTASVEERVPPFLKGQGKGWVTAEYAMLPRATHTRNHRESAKGKLTGRTMEIQRLRLSFRSCIWNVAEQQTMSPPCGMPPPRRPAKPSG